MKRKRLAVFPAEFLQRVGLLIAFVLIVASREFNARHPFLNAALVFSFAVGYFFAAMTTQRPGFLYGTLLFSAVAFFLICFGLGAPATSFPLLSVILVVCLLGVGHRLNTQSVEPGPFVQCVFRAMHITVTVFSVWPWPK